MLWRAWQELLRLFPLVALFVCSTYAVLQASAPSDGSTVLGITVARMHESSYAYSSITSSSKYCFDVCRRRNAECSGGAMVSM